ncbi:DUF2270 domain-containing protein [Tabrizicola sp.]|uniref:DUF2270 domain-containing protein n=1 Tax=Tabrizicola sp. TaxID=2005166 RepID=UPI0027329E50|nr:DUF2270 domain-containing protein [Tabrizicola sp.]MDP3197627.1 DUF2270 domain-containing protein [Tabrizicola sp.]
MWRTRLDTTTNWAVVTLGVALSITYSSPEASPLPLVLVGELILLFLTLEARRYRFFNVWRASACWIERHFFVPMLTEAEDAVGRDWRGTLAEDYRLPQYHVSLGVAVARRVRAPPARRARPRCFASRTQNAETKGLRAEWRSI